MKDQPIQIEAKSPKARFHELGSKVMAVPKDEIENREKAWRKGRMKRKKT